MKRGFLNTSKAKKAVESASATRSVTAKPSAPLYTLPPEKLSYGKVDASDRLPAGFKPNTMQGKEFSADTVDYDHHAYITTTLPSQTPAFRAEGLTECLLRGPAKRMLLAVPGFPKRLTTPNTIKYRIAEAEGMGLGMFATQNLRTGELIITERPLMLVPRAIPGSGKYPAGFTQEQVRQALMYEWEMQLQRAHARLEPDKKAAFDSLYNSHTEDGSGPILGIIRTNGYSAGNIDTDLDDDVLAYTAILDKMSRINHSCGPNSHRHFDKASLSFQLRAFRDIKAGEQIFTSYCNLLVSATARASELAPYGVKCSCSSCVGPRVEASDKLRATIKTRVTAIQQLHKSNEKNIQTLRERVVPAALACLEEMEKDGLQTEAHYGLLLGVLCVSYSTLREQVNTAQFMARLENYSEALNVQLPQN